MRNPTLYLAVPNGEPSREHCRRASGGIGTQTTPWGTTYDPAYPPPIPIAPALPGPRCAITGRHATAACRRSTPDASNASETGDPYVNNQIPVNATATPSTIPACRPAIPGVPPYIVATSPWSSPMRSRSVHPVAHAPATDSEILTNSVVNLYWPGANAATCIDTHDRRPTTPRHHLAGGPSNPYLGYGTAARDDRQHPYWRSEQLQRIMNLTTVRTHQYAVWITIGFFEVKRQGDLGMFAFNPQLAFDILGPEIGAANGKSTRYRGFYLVDRLQLTGFNPSIATAFRSAVVYRQRIQ